jgi:hypothetical protein
MSTDGENPIRLRTWAELLEDWADALEKARHERTVTAMQTNGINPDPAPRARLDTQLRDALRTSLERKAVTVQEAVYVLTNLLPELADAPIVAAHVLAAYKIAASRGIEPELKTADIEPEHE